MKLRWKIPKRPWSNSVTVTSDSPTLQHLREELIIQLSELHGISGKLFQLSLNGHTALENEDNTLLQDVGIVQGDIIYILGISEHLPPESQTSKASEDLLQQPQKLAGTDAASESGPSSEVATAGPVAENVPVQSSGFGRQDDQVPEEFQDLSQEDMVEVNRYLREPLLICESTSEAVPMSVPTLLAAMGDSITTTTDIFVGLLHILMLEMGFVPPHDQPADGKCRKLTKPADVAASQSHCRLRRGSNFSAVPSGWHFPGGYRLQYMAPLCGASTQCELVIVPMGNVVNIGTVPSVKTLILKPADFVSMASHPASLPVFHDLQKLSLKFKNAISYPLASFVQQQASHIPHFGLLALPVEIRLKLFSCLDAVSLLKLSETCRDMFQMANEACLWKMLLFRNYPRMARSLCGRDVVDWKEEYKNAYMLHKEFLKRRREWMYITPPSLFPVYFTNPPVPLMPVPGVIGGEFDRIPDLGGHLGFYPRGSNLRHPRIQPRGSFSPNFLFRW